MTMSPIPKVAIVQKSNLNQVLKSVSDYVAHSKNGHCPKTKFTSSTRTFITNGMAVCLLFNPYLHREKELASLNQKGGFVHTLAPYTVQCTPILHREFC